MRYVLEEVKATGKLDNKYNSIIVDELMVKKGGDFKTVWGVAVGDDPQQVARYKAQRGLSFPLLPDPKSSASDRWSVAALPTTDVIDKRGRIAYRMIGEAVWDAAPMRERLRALTSE